MSDRIDPVLARRILTERFGKKRYGVVFWLGFTLIFVGGFALLWYETSWKVTLAAFLIAYGVLIQAHMSFVPRD